MSVEATAAREVPSFGKGVRDFARLFRRGIFDVRKLQKVELDIHRSELFGKSPQIGTLTIRQENGRLALSYENIGEGNPGLSWNAEIDRSGMIHSVRGIGIANIDRILGMLVDVEADPHKPQLQRLAVEVISDDDMRLVSPLHIGRTLTVPKNIA